MLILLNKFIVLWLFFSLLGLGCMYSMYVQEPCIEQSLCCLVNAKKTLLLWTLMFAHLNTVLTNVSIMLVHLSYFCHSGAMEVFYGALNLWSFGFGKSGILSLIFQQRSWKSLLCICRKAKSNKFVNSTQKLGRGESGCGLVAYTRYHFLSTIIT